MIYFIKFHNGLSSNSNDWGNFDDYIGGVGSIILSFALLWFTHEANRREKDNEKNKIEIQLLQQIESTLIKIRKHECINKEITNASIYERGGLSKKTEYLLNLEIELYASYETLKILAKKSGKKAPKTETISVPAIKTYIKTLMSDSIPHIE